MHNRMAPGTLAIIPLRAGSKGLPGKNLRLLAGKPLYQHALDQALRVVGRCAITTDIPEILSAKLPSVCTVVPRPSELATDQTQIAPVLSHLFDTLLQQGNLPQRVVLLQATSPLRQDKDLIQALTHFTSGKFELVMSVTKTDPSILKYGFAEEGRFTPVSNPEFCFSNRQSLPHIVRPNGAIYVFSPKTFMASGTLATNSTGFIEMPEADSIDIDTEADLKAAEDALMQRAFSLAG